jgi:hypothetical protein
VELFVIERSIFDNNMHFDGALGRILHALSWKEKADRICMRPDDRDGSGLHTTGVNRLAWLVADILWDAHPLQRCCYRPGDRRPASWRSQMAFSS